MLDTLCLMAYNSIMKEMDWVAYMGIKVYNIWYMKERCVLGGAMIITGVKKWALMVGAVLIIGCMDDAPAPVATVAAIATGVRIQDVYDSSIMLQQVGSDDAVAEIRVAWRLADAPEDAQAGGNRIFTDVGSEPLVVDGLVPDTAYLFTVVSVDSSGNVLNTMGFTVETRWDASAPNPIRDLSGEAIVDSTKIVLRWSDSDSDDAEFVYITWTDGITAGGPVSVDQGVQTATIMGLQSTTEYTFSAIVFDAERNRSAAVTTENAISTSDISPPAAVTHVRATPLASGTAVMLEWVGSVSSDAATVHIEWSAAGVGQGERRIAHALDTQTQTIDGLTAGTVYTFDITVEDMTDNRSSTKSRSTPTATVTGFSVSAEGIISCPGVSVGGIFFSNDIMYTKRGRADITPGNAATTCTTGITNMSRLFKNAMHFNKDIGSWDVSSVTNMSGMFEMATTFNQDITNWNVGNVRNMSTMFKHTGSFNQRIGAWNVGNVTDMSGMFSLTTAFNRDIGSWDVRKVTNMSVMFNRASVFNQDIGGWNVRDVSNMRRMFEGARAFNQDLRGWCVNAVGSLPLAFDGNGAALAAMHRPVWGTCPAG